MQSTFNAIQPAIIVVGITLALGLTLWVAYDVGKRGEFTFRDGLAVLGIIVTMIVPICAPPPFGMEEKPTPMLTPEPRLTASSSATGGPTGIVTPAVYTPSPTSTQSPAEGIITGAVVNVRRGPSVAFNIIGTASKHEVYSITGKNQTGDWWEIDFKGKTGWISDSVVLAQNTATVEVVQNLHPLPTWTPTPSNFNAGLDSPTLPEKTTEIAQVTTPMVTLLPTDTLTSALTRTPTSLPTNTPRPLPTYIPTQTTPPNPTICKNVPLLREWDGFVSHGKQAKQEDVKSLQRLLNEYHILIEESALFPAALQVDGLYGKETKDAVKAIQKSGGVSVDGIVGPLTWSILCP